MNSESNQSPLQQWHSKLKEQGHCKPIAPTTNDGNSLNRKHTHKVGTMQIPIVSSNLVDHFAKKVERVARKPDTLESLFNIF